ncbi:MAG: hypothetical protein KIS92_00860 [Planctomycetota bacterium]|nr:hypothetical protein [Planctomycetota bacterium]
MPADHPEQRDARWRLQWYERMVRLEKQVREDLSDFMRNYPTDYRCKNQMENNLRKILGEITKFREGLADGTYTEHRR